MTRLLEVTVFWKTHWKRLACLVICKQSKGRYGCVELNSCCLTGYSLPSAHDFRALCYLSNHHSGDFRAVNNLQSVIPWRQRMPGTSIDNIKARGIRAPLAPLEDVVLLDACDTLFGITVNEMRTFLVYYTGHSHVYTQHATNINKYSSKNCAPERIAPPHTRGTAAGRHSYLSGGATPRCSCLK